MHITDTHGILNNERNIPPKAGAHKPRHYVPAVAMPWLANPHTLRVMPEAVSPDKIVLGLEDSRAEDDLELVLSFPDLGCDVKFMGDHSVLR